MMFRTQEKKHTNALKSLLDGFPDIEIWRFFIERNRYKHNKNLRENLIQKFISLTDMSKETIEIQLENLLVKDLFDLAEQTNDKELIVALKYIFNLEGRDKEKVIDVINRHQAWIGFEENEPGYLFGVTKGLLFIFKHIIDKTNFDVDMIKELHKICTSGVKKMLNHTPGEFRKAGVAWGMDTKFDSLPGLKENLKYIREFQEKNLSNDFYINISPINNISNKTPQIIDNFNTDTDKMAEEIWDKLKTGEFFIQYGVRENKDENFLNKVSELHIRELEESLKNKNEDEKVIAIFTYLKHTVLHHSFGDGVGRTYSMLLLQYLLLRENLLPILITNSNIIPGLSVNEMVAEYQRGKIEMEKILENPTFINSEKFCDSNVDTNQLLNMLPKKDQAILTSSVTEYKETKELLLQSLDKQEKPIESPKI